MCSMLQRTFMKTTPERSRLQTSTRSCFRKSRTIHRRHGRASTSRSSTSPSSRPARLRLHSSATFRSISANLTAASLRTSFEPTSTSSDARFRFSFDRNNINERPAMLAFYFWHRLCKMSGTVSLVVNNRVIVHPESVVRSAPDFSLSYRRIAS